MFRRALATSTCVGSILTLLNQWSAIFGTAEFSLIAALLTYLVPFCVSTMTALIVQRGFKAELSSLDSNRRTAIESLSAATGALETIQNNARKVNAASSARAEMLGTLMQTAQELQQSLLAANKSTEDTRARIDSATKSSNDIVQSSSRIREANTLVSDISRKIDTAIEQLADKSKAVADIAARINKITAKTKLLSVNASIEASRAGEHGHGFSVVAHAVGELSEATRSAANMATAAISDQQAGLTAARASLNSMFEAMDRSLSDSQENENAAANIDREVAATRDMNHDVSSTMSRQVILFDQILEFLVKIQADTEAAIKGSATNIALAGTAVSELQAVCASQLDPDVDESAAGTGATEDGWTDAQSAPKAASG